MSYRDFDDGLKMPAGIKKSTGNGANPRSASPNGSHAARSQKSAAPNGQARPASANSKSGNVKPAQPNAYSRPDVTAAKSGKSKQPRRNRGLIKALIAVFCVLVAGVVAIGIYFVSRWKDDDYSSLQAANLVVLAPDPEPTEQPTQASDLAAVAPAPTETPDDSAIVYNGQTYVKNRNIVNLLFLGIDTNADRKKNMRGYRSDMLMVCAVDIAAKKATLISIPRDTYTTMYKVDENTGEVKEVVQDKINAAYSYGGGATHYSYANAMACVEMFLERRCELRKPLDFELDIPVYLYAGVDMDGITQVATAVGGVEVTLDQSIPGVGKKGQTVTLKYKNAFEFITNRKDTGGDESRASHQQQFMVALAKKIKSMGPVDMILSLYDDLQKYVWTNLNTDQMIDFAKILTKVDIDSIEMHMVTGDGETKGSYHMLHDEEATLQLLLDVYYTKVS